MLRRHRTCTFLLSVCCFISDELWLRHSFASKLYSADGFSSRSRQSEQWVCGFHLRPFTFHPILYFAYFYGTKRSIPMEMHIYFARFHNKLTSKISSLLFTDVLAYSLNKRDFSLTWSSQILLFFFLSPLRHNLVETNDCYSLPVCPSVFQSILPNVWPSISRKQDWGKRTIVVTEENQGLKGIGLQ